MICAYQSYGGGTEYCITIVILNALNSSFHLCICSTCRARATYVIITEMSSSYTSCCFKRTHFLCSDVDNTASLHGIHSQPYWTFNRPAMGTCHNSHSSSVSSHFCNIAVLCIECNFVPRMTWAVGSCRTIIGYSYWATQLTKS